MRTTHQFLDKYPIPADSRKLIVGTIHPHDHNSFKLPFFYGNVVSIWTLLSNAFPQELHQPLTLPGVLAFLNERKIAVSDTIRVCNRKNPTALDEDLVPVELNHQIVEDIRHSEITEILFTSGFGKNNAFRLFYSNILGLAVNNEIKDNRGLTLDNEIFGRSVKLTVLYSPSGASNVGLSKSAIYLNNRHKYTHSPTPVLDFKVDYYREMFSD